MLVQIVYDDSFWVFWWELFFYSDTLELGLAKDMTGLFPFGYAVFTGQEELEETAMYAKLAN